MDITDLPIMSAIKQRMRWLTAKQGVIAENVANASTPGYRPRGLKEQSFADLMDKVPGKTASAAGGPSQMKMSKSLSGHFDIGGAAQDRPAVVARPRTLSDQTRDGNGVVLEEQLVDLAETQIEYQTMLSVYRKQSSILKTALGRGGR